MIKKFKLNTFGAVFVNPESISNNLTTFFSFILRVILFKMNISRLFYLDWQSKM